MRVLVVTQEARSAPGGPSTWLPGLLQALTPLHQTGLLVPSGHDLSPFERAGIAPLFTAPRLTAAGTGESDRLGGYVAEFARRQEVALVHLAGAPMAPLAPALAEAGLPSVLTLLGADLPEPDGEGEGLAAGMARASRVTAVSRTAAARAADLGFAGPVRWIPPGIDLERFQPGDRVAARCDLGLPPDRPLLLLLGRLEVGKGPLEALEALRLLADLDPLLVVAGVGPDAERVDARVRFLALEERVRRTGVCDGDLLLRLYQAADLALLPARDEAAAGLGLAAIEAAACALPVVASRAGALAEVVEDGRTGLLVPARDAPSLAAAARTLLSDPGRAAALGREARRKAEETLGWDAVARQLAAVYEEAASGEPAGAAAPPPPRPRYSGASRPRPRIAVFMPTWRCRRWLPRAIQAVLDQSWPRVDLYVADDASGDLDAEIEERFPTVTFLTLRDQGGPYRIDNLLLSLTESELVAFHDADDWSRPDRFAAQVDYLLERGFDGCGSWYRLVDLHGDPIGFDTVPEHATLSLRDFLADQVLHPTTLYRREVLDRLGGFDADTRFSGDTEMIYRAFPSFDLGNVQRFLYERTVHPGSLTQSAETGINSPARVAYLARVRAAAEAVRTGEAPPPPPGMTLAGRPTRQPSPDLIVRLRPGRGNSTLKERWT